MKEKWIYLKSNNLIDVMALATVLSTSKTTFNVIKRHTIAVFLQGLENINLSFFDKTKDVELVEIAEIEEKTFSQKCSTIFERIGIKEPQSYECYITTKSNEQVKLRWGDEKRILVCLGNNACQPDDLILVDQVIRLFEKQGMYAVSGGSNMLPCIKGTKDFRQLIGLPEINALKDKILFILTSEEDIVAMEEIFNIPTFVIKTSGDQISINGVQVSDILQIMNYILRYTNHK